MGQALVVVDRGVGFGPGELAAWWGEDAEAVGLGQASVQEGVNPAFGPEIFEWVAIPLGVNLASSALYDLVKRLVTRSRAATQEGAVEIVHSTTGEGDPVVVVRSQASSGR
jgi:hypothetical protein